MLSIKDLAADKRTITIPYGEHEVHVTYRPSTITVAFSKRVGVDDISEIAATAIDAWDVADDDGNPYPLTADKLAELSVGFLRRVMFGSMEFDGILDDVAKAGLPEVPAPSDAS